MEFQQTLKKYDSSFEEMSKKGRKILSNLKKELKKSSLIGIRDIDETNFEFSFWNIWYKVEADLVIVNFNPKEYQLDFKGEVNTYIDYEDDDKVNPQLVYSVRFDEHGNLINSYQEISSAYIREYLNLIIRFHYDNEIKFSINKNE